MGGRRHLVDGPQPLETVDQRQVPPQLATLTEHDTDTPRQLPPLLRSIPPQRQPNRP
jgi:hypothetical protein